MLEITSQPLSLMGLQEYKRTYAHASNSFLTLSTPLLASAKTMNYGSLKLLSFYTILEKNSLPRVSRRNKQRRLERGSESHSRRRDRNTGNTELGLTSKFVRHMLPGSLVKHFLLHAPGFNSDTCASTTSS